MLPNYNGQIMATYRCSAACRHCLVMAAPRQDEALVSVEAAVQYGLDFAALGRAVMIAGGEALLYFEHVLEMVRALAAAGVPVAFVESNGSWCSSDALTRRRLSLLQDAGVQGMYFSVDRYHQEFVPAERVYRGVSISWELFGRGNVSPAELSLDWALETERLAQDPEHLRHAHDGAGIHFIGRAALELAPLAAPVPLEELLTEDCAENLDIDTRHELQVDPYGFVRPDWCPGVNLGNTRSHRIVDLCRTRHVQETPLLREIAERGPAALLPLAQRYGITAQPAYASKCHLCFDLRRQLVHHMREEFGPRQVYEVAKAQRSGSRSPTS